VAFDGDGIAELRKIFTGGDVIVILNHETLRYGALRHTPAPIPSRTISSA